MIRITRGELVGLGACAGGLAVEALAIRSGGAVPDPYVLITVRRFVPKGAP